MTGDENHPNFGPSDHHLGSWSATEPPISPWESDYSFPHHSATEMSFTNPFLPDDGLNLHHNPSHTLPSHGTESTTPTPLYPMTSTASGTNYSPTSVSSSASPSSAYPYPGSGNSAATIDDPTLAAAIEEDKRRRNTAASARFRLKKKEREADLEKRTRDMNVRCEELQRRIGALETENRWLRELITERSRNRKRKGPASMVLDMLREREKSKGKKIIPPVHDEDDEEEVEA